MSGNEESVARSVIFAAHNTAQLSAYVSDVANVSTDITLSESKSFHCVGMHNKIVCHNFLAVRIVVTKQYSFYIPVFR